MTKAAPKKLTKDDKNQIVSLYANGKGLTQYRLADLFQVHRRSIHRVLQEADVLPPRFAVSHAEAAILNLVRKCALTIDDIKKLGQRVQKKQKALNAA